jgi:hypothetical protein
VAYLPSVRASLPQKFIDKGRVDSDGCVTLPFAKLITFAIASTQTQLGSDILSIKFTQIALYERGRSCVHIVKSGLAEIRFDSLETFARKRNISCFLGNKGPSKRYSSTTDANLSVIFCMSSSYWSIVS